MPSVRFGNHRISLPGSRLGRIVLGVALMMGGFLWFLPVLGLWMLPLGLVVLSVDFPFVRRWRRQQTEDTFLLVTPTRSVQVDTMPIWYALMRMATLLGKERSGAGVGIGLLRCSKP